ncbi:CST complex subunit STN1 [Hypomesus transpacificus]|uniref:CST complex subunit STN1 n=1 Tax=Hypomesus transpacificus TaxID=137520 RepID=UPI001F076BE0|nr:CST complex subunit STN1 [Hypomesus transpacificus]
MQPAPMDPGEEPPSMLWGLDPVFTAFARLYIEDILQMRESCQIPGIYFYNSHPIYKVDVLGTVVYKREREDFFCYGVDDGTGVINCLCWKKEKWRDQTDPGKSSSTSLGDGPGGFNPVKELERLRQAQRTSSHLEIGELIRVRGPVKTSRQQREIMASTYYKVSDPVMAVQIAWMTEVPGLYRQCYDKPFNLENSAQGPQTAGGSAAFLLGQATRVLKEYLKKKEVSRLRPYDVLDLLQPLVTSRPQPTAADQEPVAGPSASKRLRQLLKESLQVLQDEGVVFRKVKSQDEVYHVTERDKELQMTAKDIVREDSRREKYAEKGCHVLHILSGVRQRYSPNMSKSAIELVLKALECNSDIISTSENHYTIL